MKKALIVRAAKKEFDCRVESRENVVKAQALGNLLRGENSLVVGDWVLLDDNDVIVQRLERENEIFRVLPRESKKKVSAANCQRMVILTSVSRPEYKSGLVDRFLVRALQWEVRPLVVFNKMDEHDPQVVDLEFEALRLKRLGVDCFEITCEDPNYQPQYLPYGLADLKNQLEDKTTIFVGQSGVGKSSTINMLSDGQLDLKTKSIGRAGKGSHTTTWSEIIDVGPFRLMDSPGIRSFSLEDLNPDELIEYFPDLEELSVQCKFRNCQHEPHSKGCAFLELGDSREDQALRSRLESYKKIRVEVSVTPTWAKKI